VSLRVGRARTAWGRAASLRTPRLVALSLLVVGLLSFAPGAQARSAANLSLVVTFTATGDISVTLPDGTPVGSASGTPTVIPAGFYTVLLTGPGGCTSLPYFDLRGPGNNIVDNMDEGEMSSAIDNANFLPNSTYTWRNDGANPPVVYTFTTSSTILGTPPVQPTSSTTGISSGEHSTAASQDVVGSELVPFRGTLAGAVSAAGTTTLAYKGQSVSKLTAGKYTVTVNDKSTKSGFMLEQASHPAVTTGAVYVGKHSVSVHLTAGRWFFAPGLTGQKTYFTVVS
jgi:hypothetical protein